MNLNLSSQKLFTLFLKQHLVKQAISRFFHFLHTYLMFTQELQTGEEKHSVTVFSPQTRNVSPFAEVPE